MTAQGKEGKVYLVGAGPGGPALLTLRAAEVLRQAEVVVYDRLVAPEILSLAPHVARRIYVGKSPARRAMEQEEINALLVREASAGRRVVRLKGGDPFVFGRGGEEALALHQAGLPFEVVPGLTAGLAGPAYAGIPVTQRGLASAVVLVTGHEDPAKPESDLDYEALARVSTIVFYMGVGQLQEITARLMAAGRAAETPAAIIQWAATTRQRTILATLATLADRAAQAGLAAPAVVVVGQVAALRQELAWFERLPLFGLTIVVTRARRPAPMLQPIPARRDGQASDLAGRLRELGARALELPTIAIEPVSGDRLAAALARLGEFQWLVFTSANAVDIFFAALREQGGDARRLAGLKVAAIGPGTADALAQHGVRADLLPPEAVAEALADALLAAGVGPRARVLLPRAAEARDVLPQALRRAGATVEDVAIYRTVVPREVDEQILAEVVDDRADLVAFTSSSTARHFVELIRAHAGTQALARVRERVKFAAIGPITAGTARELGFEVAVESPEHTIAGLVEAICRWAALLRTEERST